MLPSASAYSTTAIEGVILEVTTWYDVKVLWIDIFLDYHTNGWISDHELYRVLTFAENTQAVTYSKTKHDNWFHQEKFDAMAEAVTDDDISTYEKISEKVKRTEAYNANNANRTCSVDDEKGSC